MGKYGVSANSRKYFDIELQGQITQASLVKLFGHIPGAFRMAKAVCRAINAVSFCSLQGCSTTVRTRKPGQKCADDSPHLAKALFEADPEDLAEFMSDQLSRGGMEGCLKELLKGEEGNLEGEDADPAELHTKEELGLSDEPSNNTDAESEEKSSEAAATGEEPDDEPEAVEDTGTELEGEPEESVKNEPEKKEAIDKEQEELIKKYHDAMCILAELLKKGATEEQLAEFAELHPDLMSLGRDEWFNVTQMCFGTELGDNLNEDGLILTAAAPPIPRAVAKGKFDEHASSLDFFKAMLCELRKLFYKEVERADGMKVDTRIPDRLFMVIMSFVIGVQGLDNMGKGSKVIYNAIGKELMLTKPPGSIKSFIRWMPSGDEVHKAFDAIVKIFTERVKVCAVASSGEPLTDTSIISLDGKRSNSTDFSGGNALVMQNRSDYQLGCITDNRTIEYKGSSEGDASIDMLKGNCPPPGSIVTSDAAGTLVKVVTIIFAQELNLCLAVKGNEGTLYKGLKKYAADTIDEISNAYTAFVASCGHSTKNGIPEKPPVKAKKEKKKKKQEEENDSAVTQNNSTATQNDNKSEQKNKKGKEPKKECAETIEECKSKKSPAYYDPYANEPVTLGFANKDSRPVPYFAVPLKDGGMASVKTTVDDNHGAITVRQYGLLKKEGLFEEKWGGDKCNAGYVCQLTFPKDKKAPVTAETRFFLTSVDSPQVFALSVRRHWKVEVAHFLLDYAFSDDSCRLGVKSKAAGFQLCRKLALLIVCQYRAARFENEKSFNSTAEWLGVVRKFGNLGAAFCPESFTSAKAVKAT
ncbi:MAG: hypothetical protein LBT59_23510 [Clostridiales bacterium]|nr:hypothetical protein [Clostridiales bacterium]